METELEALISWAVKHHVSDLHLSAGQKLFFRQKGKLLAKSDELLTDSFLSDAIHTMLTDAQKTSLMEHRELDFSWETEQCRLRGNIYLQRGQPAIALRLIPDRIPSLAELGAPSALFRLLQVTQGFLLVTGRTGSGKSTTLAAFLHALMAERSVHLLTLEDPIEFLHRSSGSFISQREYGRDFLSFPHALKNALREMPDVLLIGEIRDAKTMQLALEAASTGIFVLGTLHTKGAAETALRMENLFPLHQRETVRNRFADAFTGIFSQCLLPSISGDRVCATEVLLATPATRNLIRQGKYNQLPSVMLSSQDMNTMEHAVKNLFQQNRISPEIWNAWNSPVP